MPASTALTPRAILDLHDAARGADHLSAALMMWQAVDGRDAATLADLPIADRDRALFASRIATFGAAAECYVECPECAEPLEFELDIGGLVAAPGEHRGVVHHEVCELAFRLPTTSDLQAISGSPDPRSALVARCVDSAPEPLTSELCDAVDASMAALDPQVDIELKLDCASCAHTWIARFDIGAFYQREVEVEARRLLREIHALARAYGWSEAEILELSPARRRSYLELMS